MSDLLTFAVTFVDADRSPVGEPAEIFARDHWEACQIALEMASADADDFVVREVA